MKGLSRVLWLVSSIDNVLLFEEEFSTCST